MSNLVQLRAEPPVGKDTPHERILQAGLKVFAERGFQVATVRDVTDVANVNVAAVNYYYGSKDALIRAVLIRYVSPMVEARRQALDLLLDCDGRVTTRLIVEAMVRPMVSFSHDDWGGRSVVQLLLQTRAFPRPEFQDIVAELFDPISHRFVEAFIKATPSLKRPDAYWRYNFCLGAIMQVLTDANPATRRLELLSGGLCRLDDDVIAAQLIDFISGGITAARRATARVKPTARKRNQA